MLGSRSWIRRSVLLVLALPTVLLPSIVLPNLALGLASTPPGLLADASTPAERATDDPLPATSPPLTLSLPPSVPVGGSVQVVLSAPLPADAEVELWPRDPTAPLPGRGVALLEGEDTVELQAPDVAGWYDVRVLDAGSGRVMAGAEVEVTEVDDSTRPSCDVPADQASLEEAFTTIAENLLRIARLSYRMTYDDVAYDYSVTRAEVTDDVGTVDARYSASARELATGETVQASGTLRATLDWVGCRWTMRDFTY